MASSAILKIDVLADASRAVAGFNSVGTAATKQSSKLKKFSGVMAAGFAVAGGAALAFGKEAVDAASEDAKAQALLATALKNTTGATDAQVAAGEEFISQLSTQAAVTDDELRPALSTLTRAFGDQMQAQRNLALATNIAAGTGKPLAAVVKAMASAAQGSTGAFAKLTGQTTKLGGEAKTMDQLLGEAAKTFSGQAAIAAESTAGKMELAKISMGELTEEVGTALLPVIGKLATILSENVVPALSAVFAFISDNIQWIGPLVGGILAIVAAMKAWSIIQGVLNAVMALNPIVLIIAAIAALIAIVVLLVKNWDKVVDFLKKAWEALKTAATAVFTAIGNVIKKVWESIKATAIAIWNAIKAFFTAYWEALKTIFGTPLAWIKDKVSTVFNAVKDTIKTVWNGIKDFFSTIWTSITAIFQTAWDWFETFMTYLGGLGDSIGDMWEGVTGALSTAWEGVITGLKAGVNFFINGINLAIQGVNWLIDQVNKLPGVNIGHIPTIPTLAHGGVLTQPTLFVGGEAGTEIVTPEKLLRSILREEGGIGGGSYVLNMNVKRADPADVAWGFRRLELLRTGR